MIEVIRNNLSSPASSWPLALVSNTLRNASTPKAAFAVSLGEGSGPITKIETGFH
jgi:hypothetical protein